MADKNVLVKFQTLTNGNMSGNLTSAVTNIQYLNDVALQFNWTGTPIGTFSVLVSIDYSQDAAGNVLNAGNWNALTLSPSPAASGSAGSWYVDLNEISAPWIKATYTAGSSTGTLNVFICGKGI